MMILLSSLSIFGCFLFLSQLVTKSRRQTLKLLRIFHVGVGWNEALSLLSSITLGGAIDLQDQFLVVILPGTWQEESQEKNIDHPPKKKHMKKSAPDFANARLQLGQSIPQTLQEGPSQGHLAL